MIDFQAVLIDGAFPDQVCEELVARVLRYIVNQDTRGLITPQSEAGSVGENARSIGAASSPIFRSFCSIRMQGHRSTRRRPAPCVREIGRRLTAQLAELSVPGPLGFCLWPPIKVLNHFVLAPALLILGRSHRISNRRRDFTDFPQHVLCSFVGPPTAIIGRKVVKIMVAETITWETSHLAWSKKVRVLVQTLA